MKESHLRSVIKATSWRLFGTFSTTMLAYMVTQKWDVSLYIGSLEFVSKICLYYFHERLWIKIPFGLLHGSVQEVAPQDVVIEWQDS